MSQAPLSLDRYLREHYEAVPGMSSAFAARACATLMQVQAGQGWRGDVAEIGAFEGRFLIALALGLQAGERALAIDRFDWPDIHVGLRLSERLRGFGLSERVETICADSRRLRPQRLTGPDGARAIRLFHIDGDHQASSLAQDMALAFACMAPWGVVCLDDMLSPAYPELGIAVAQTLQANPQWTVFCVLDREDIAAAAKFLLCRQEYAQPYVDALTQSFPHRVWGMAAQFAQHRALVLSPQPRLTRFNPGGSVDRIQ